MDAPKDLGEHQLQQRVTRVERWFKLVVGGWIVSAGVLLVAAWTPPQLGDQDVVRVRALIVLDDRGRERIALGAPIPDLRAGARESPANGMVILGENGRDRVVVGAPTPDPRVQGQLVRRIAPSSGIQINDPEGNERAGFGYLDNGQVGFGLDYENGEAITLGVHPNGSAAVRVNGRNRKPRAFLGTTPGDSMTRFVLYDTSGTARMRVAVRPDMPSEIALLDEDGKPVSRRPEAR